MPRVHFVAADRFGAKLVASIGFRIQGGHRSTRQNGRALGALAQFIANGFIFGTIGIRFATAAGARPTDGPQLIGALHHLAHIGKRAILTLTDARAGHVSCLTALDQLGVNADGLVPAFSIISAGTAQEIIATDGRRIGTTLPGSRRQVHIDLRHRTGHRFALGDSLDPLYMGYK